MRLSNSLVSRGAAALTVLLAAVAAPRPAAAQELRLTVRDSASRQPIPTVVVIFDDSAGAPVVRYLTNERGELHVALSAGIRRAQLLRIGFRPRDVTLPPATGGVIVLDLGMQSIPTLLEPMHVIDSPNCPRRDDRSAAFALWEQARAALLAAVVARESEQAVIKRLHFDRQMGSDGFTAASQRVQMDTSAGAKPFVATHPAAEFIERGFVDDSAGVAMFNGPDADVMLDDAFARGYCFHLADADSTRPHAVGVAFDAANHKRGRVDVEGALWVDSTSRSLEEIDFRYVGIDRRFDAYRPGGRVSFHTMEDGTPVIDRWVIRPVGVPATSRRVAVNPADFHESGGEVARAHWGDGKTWVAPLGTLSGAVTHAGIPAARVRVNLVGTDYFATSDSTGRFTMVDLVPGPYTIAVVDTALAALNLVLKTQVSFVAARDTTTTVVFEGPTVDEFATQLCSASLSPATAVIIGRGLLADDGPASRAHVEVTSLDGPRRQTLFDDRLDKTGNFHVCGVPRGATIEVRAELATRGAVVSTTTTLLADRLVNVVRLVLQPTSR